LHILCSTLRSKRLNQHSSNIKTPEPASAQVSPDSRLSVLTSIHLRARPGTHRRGENCALRGRRLRRRRNIRCNRIFCSRYTCSWVLEEFHSIRIAEIGSTLTAFNAGARLPTRAMSRQRQIAARNVVGSAGLTPASRDSIARPAA
jgi:hypothetical protein